MLLHDAKLPPSWSWEPISKHYRITKRPREVSFKNFDRIPFVSMDAVPANGRETTKFELRTPANIASGTYFERGDVLLSKITPSFENGKQGLVTNIPGKFGIASTEIIPLQAINGDADNRFLFFYLLHHEVRSALASRMEGSTGRQRVPEHAVRELVIPFPPKPEQRKIALVLCKIQNSIEIEERIVAATRELKSSLMRRLFAEGLCNEPQNITDIGLVPQTWKIVRLELCCDVVNSSLSYTDFAMMPEAVSNGSVAAMAIKVSDMNLLGNETKIVCANLQKHVDAAVAVRKLIPADTIVFPKRGAAIATNKKRMTTQWTALDPNLIGVRAGADMDSNFLFYWFQKFDLRSITEPGPTPQLNKKNLTPLLLPCPPSLKEQRDIASILQTIDCKISVHERKRATLQELFRTLLHQLMTGQTRVADLDINVSAFQTP